MSTSRAERQIILLSAGTTARRQAMRERAIALIPQLDWVALAETLRLRRLLPTLGPRIIETASGHASDRFVADVTRATDVGRRQGAFLQLITVQLMTALGRAGIRSTPLK